MIRAIAVAFPRLDSIYFLHSFYLLPYSLFDDGFIPSSLDQRKRTLDKSKYSFIGLFLLSPPLCCIYPFCRINVEGN